MKNWSKRVLATIGRHLDLAEVQKQQQEMKILCARVAINQMKMMSPIKTLAEAEFKVFSQFGDDGILQYIIHQLKIAPERRIFVEFGVENYEESNTRFLMMNDNWRGLVMDGSDANMEHVRASDYFWKHSLIAVAAFIDSDNINALISNAGIAGDIGLLSVDIDGNDYWVWKRIDVVRPVIVVAEYNGVFGDTLAVSVPYDSSFRRSAAHHSNLYWGCSLGALAHLASTKGYVFLGCNSAGNNAYFVRQDQMIDNLPRPSLREGFVDPKFRESRDASGNLSYLTGSERLEAIKNLKLTDVISGQIDYISNLYRVVLK